MRIKHFKGFGWSLNFRALFKNNALIILFSISLTCPMHVPYMSLTCPFHIPYMSLTCPLHVQWTCNGQFVHYMPFSYPFHIPYTSLKCTLHIPYISLACPLYIAYMSLTCPLHSPNMSLSWKVWFYKELRFVYEDNNNKFLWFFVVSKYKKKLSFLNLTEFFCFVNLGSTWMMVDLSRTLKWAWEILVVYLK